MLLIFVGGLVVNREVAEVWESIKDRVPVTFEKFMEIFEELKGKYGEMLSDKALAIMAAKRLGVSVSTIFSPPIIGRVLEVGPVRTKGTIYRLFTVVDEVKRYFCVAFGPEHIQKLEMLEDKVVRITNYVVARMGDRVLYRVTEASALEELPDGFMAETYELPPARVPSLEFLKKQRGQRVFTAVVLHQEYTENLVCPECKRPLTLTEEDEWYCQTHGVVEEPERRRIYRYQLADKSGVYQGVYFGTPPEENLEDYVITAKGYFRGEDLYITKIYKFEKLEP